VKKNVHKVLVGKLERNHLEVCGEDGRITLKYILTEEGGEGVDWINLPLDRQK
jgi:hypothetical protein